jgi:23S rRNA pseudouridine1911/1915/1917 synthase
MVKFTVPSESNRLRADVYLAEQYPDFTRATLQKLFSHKFVSVDGEPVKGGYRVHTGDVLDVDDSSLNVIPGEIELTVLYMDDDVVVINKPIGILSHSKGAYNAEATVATFMQRYVSDELQNERAGIVHRLDRATSGVMICARNADSLGWLQKQFSQRKTKKTYHAIVTGTPEPLEAIIDIPILRNPKVPKTFKPDAKGKPAQTRYLVLSETKQHSLLELKPVTGRTHQLRVHLKHIGHPIVGDTFYEGEPAERLFLHALSLELTLPSKERATFTAPEPDEFATFMKGDE